MFSLQDLVRTQYVVFGINDIDGETGITLPNISASSQTPHINVDVSQITERESDFLDSWTADTLRQGEQNVDLSEIYSDSYRLIYISNRAAQNVNNFINLNGGKVTTGYVGNGAIPPS